MLSTEGLVPPRNPPVRAEGEAAAFKSCWRWTELRGTCRTQLPAEGEALPLLPALSHCSPEPGLTPAAPSSAEAWGEGAGSAHRTPTCPRWVLGFGNDFQPRSVLWGRNGATEPGVLGAKGAAAASAGGWLGHHPGLVSRAAAAARPARGCQAGTETVRALGAARLAANSSVPASAGLDSEMLYRTSGSELRQALRTGKNQLCVVRRRIGSDGGD